MLTVYQISYGYVSQILDYESFKLSIKFLSRRWFSANNFISKNNTSVIFEGLKNYRFLVCAKFFV